MDNLYKLRSNFAIIGLTGRSGSGCSELALRLEQKDTFHNLLLKDFDNNDVEDLKLNICQKYLKHESNWKPFKVIKYSAVLIYHLLHESSLYNDYETSKEKLESFILNACSSIDKDRFNKEDKEKIRAIVSETFDENLYQKISWHDCIKLHYCLKDKSPNEICEYFWDAVTPFSELLLNKLKQYSYNKAAIFIQDIACNLRSFGTICPKGISDINNVYTVAETINRLIKAHRKLKDANDNDNDLGHGRIVIDSLKNSLELTYFREKYSGFYCIATNKLQKECDDYKLKKFRELFLKNAEENLKHNKKIDALEYKGGEVNSGEFSSPDIENCIQKSDFHIFWSEDFTKYKTDLRGENENSVNLERQLLKFIALLFVPGIITPSPSERTMQIAFNAKANSGCISRQVGAVITDEYYSTKAIGWNDVARYQIPCNLRSAHDLITNITPNHFSKFERGIEGEYSDGGTFLSKISEEIQKVDANGLEGRTCAFCFKSCHNAFEGKENQVHTRSLHAEENAMLQITKYGGQGVKDGILFTTASPCELCSKKAFQLGIKTIYYIDPYPGIAGAHILTSAKEPEKNPCVKMFRGAVGRAYHKLYEPFMNYKDEISIRTGFKPQVSKDHYISKLTKDPEKQKRIADLLNGGVVVSS